MNLIKDEQFTMIGAHFELSLPADLFLLVVTTDTPFNWEVDHNSSTASLPGSLLLQVLNRKQS